MSLEELRIHRLLVAIDGSESSTLALRAAVSVARHHNATVTLLTVAPDASAQRTGFALAAGLPPMAQETLDAEAEKILRAAVAEVPEDIPVHTVVQHGKAGPAIVAHARAGNYDAIMLGARGVGRVGAIMGSVSAHVLRHAEGVNVFVAHSGV